MERSAWVDDTRLHDPIAKQCTVTVDGVQFDVTNRMGPGWFMTIRNVTEPGTIPDMVGTVEWNDWHGVEEKIRQYLVTR